MSTGVRGSMELVEMWMQWPGVNACPIVVNFETPMVTFVL